MERLLLELASIAVRIHYRVERLGGQVPADGPLVLVGNHPNGLVDPIVLAGATSRRVRFLGKAPLFHIPVLGRVVRGMKVLPVHRPKDGADTERNRTTFAAVFDALADGDVVCLFPEGESHSDPRPRRLKTGAARMALGAEAESNFTLGVRIVPVGLVYRARRRFRSKVATWIGEPVEVRDLAEGFAADEREAVRALTERIHHALGEVTWNLDAWGDLPLLELAERIWSDGTEASLERTKQFADGLRLLREADPRRMDDVAFRVGCFRDRLRHLGLTVGDLSVEYSPGSVLRFTVRTGIDLALRLPLAAIGGAYWWSPFALSRRLGLRFAPSVDTTATTILLAAIVFFPLWHLAAVVATWLLCDGAWAIGLAVVLPLLAPFAAGFPTWIRTVVDDVSVFLRLGHRRRLRAGLRRQRDGLAAEIEALAAEVRAIREGRGSNRHPADA